MTSHLERLDAQFSHACLSPDDVAAYLGFKRTDIYKMVADTSLRFPAKRMGGRLIVIDKIALGRWLDMFFGNELPATPPTSQTDLEVPSDSAVPADPEVPEKKKVGRPTKSNYFSRKFQAALLDLIPPPSAPSDEVLVAMKKGVVISIVETAETYLKARRKYRLEVMSLGEACGRPWFDRMAKIRTRALFHNLVAEKTAI